MLLPWCAYAQEVDTSQEISIAGFFPLQGSGRQVYNFNPGWRFYRGDVKGAEAADFNDIFLIDKGLDNGRHGGFCQSQRFGQRCPGYRLLADDLSQDNSAVHIPDVFLISQRRHIGARCLPHRDAFQG